jgi:plasmid maintenance system killer protein
VSTLNRSFGERSFDKTTLNNTAIGGKKRTIKGKHHKFLFVSLAMLSAKANGEDRTILRRMRLEKGGVVDLAQENAKKNKI